MTAPLSMVATWTHDMAADADRYVETVAPLAHDVAVQDAVVARISDEFSTRLDIATLTEKGASTLTDRGLPSGL